MKVTAKVLCLFFFAREKFPSSTRVVTRDWTTRRTSIDESTFCRNLRV
jgi:hypothetical protein